MITNLEHIGLSVSDLERSIDFYCKNLNCQVIRIIEADPKLKLGQVVGMNDCLARIAHLKAGNTMLELFEYLEPRGKKIPENKRQADLGFIHAGFTSTDVRDDYRRMKENGVQFISEPVEFRPNVWICYFHGPDREVCEIRES
jgi:catechol 2,3-dioxygenase-like lactoylglutathione lyase family enzyme